MIYNVNKLLSNCDRWNGILINGQGLNAKRIWTRLDPGFLLCFHEMSRSEPFPEWRARYHNHPWSFESLILSGGYYSSAGHSNTSAPAKASSSFYFNKGSWYACDKSLWHTVEVEPGHVAYSVALIRKSPMDELRRLTDDEEILQSGDCFRDKTLDGNYRKWMNVGQHVFGLKLGTFSDQMKRYGLQFARPIVSDLGSCPTSTVHTPLNDIPTEIEKFKKLLENALWEPEFFRWSDSKKINRYKTTGMHEGYLACNVSNEFGNVPSFSFTYGEDNA